MTVMRPLSPNGRLLHDWRGNRGCIHRKQQQKCEKMLPKFAQRFFSVSKPKCKGEGLKKHPSPSMHDMCRIHHLLQLQGEQDQNDHYCICILNKWHCKRLPFSGTGTPPCSHWPCPRSRRRHPQCNRVGKPSARALGQSLQEERDPV